MYPPKNLINYTIYNIRYPPKKNTAFNKHVPIRTFTAATSGRDRSEDSSDDDSDSDDSSAAPNFGCALRASGFWPRQEPAFWGEPTGSVFVIYLGCSCCCRMF